MINKLRTLQLSILVLFVYLLLFLIYFFHFGGNSETSAEYITKHYKRDKTSSDSNNFERDSRNDDNESSLVNGIVNATSRYNANGSVKIPERLLGTPQHLNTPIRDDAIRQYETDMHQVFGEEPLELPWCPLVEEHYMRYEFIRNAKEKYFIALNLFNSEVVVPNLGIQILTFAEFVGRDRVFVSIFENGSGDKTGYSLQALKYNLEELGIAHHIVTLREEPINWDEVFRIETLANLRNLAIDTLLKDKNRLYQQLVFINDVFFCFSDILELLYQQYVQSSDIACALDFVYPDWYHPENEPLFYDTWVARDMSGQRFWNSWPEWKLEMMAGDPSSRQRWSEGLPYQAWSCWNGMALLDTEPFYQGVKFRRSYVDQGECAASECTLIAKDFWELGFGRVIVVPSVKVLYWSGAFEKTHAEQPPYSEIISAELETEEDFKGKNWVQKFWKHTDREQAIKWRPAPEVVLCLPLDGPGVIWADDGSPVWEESPNRNSSLNRPDRLLTL